MQQQNQMRALIGASLLGFIGLGMAFHLAATQKPELGIQEKISPAIFKAFEHPTTKNFVAPVEEVDVVVIMKDQADLSAADRLPTKNLKGQFVYQALIAKAEESQKDLIEWLSQHELKFKRFYIANMISVKSMSLNLIEELAARTDITRIILDPRVKMIAPIISPRRTFLSRTGIEENIVATGASKVWEEFHVKGAGIVVSGQDTGVQWDHPALKAQYRGFDRTKNEADHRLNWHDSIVDAIESNGSNRCGYNSLEPCDDNQHGTHTIGTMVGDDGEGNQIGMAPEAQWIACRNMDANVGRPTTYIDCFEFLLAPYPQGENSFTRGDPTAAPHIVNNSWGCPVSEGCEGSEMVLVLKAMKAAGIMVIVSAGNDGSSCKTIQDQPATISDFSFSVGAINHRTNKITSFSSRGPSLFDQGIGPDVTAPGDSIRSAVPGSAYEGGWSGTSMAGPHVAGLVALLWSANKNLIGKIDETADIIRKTAIPKQTLQRCGDTPGTAIPNNTYGYGIIDAYAAVKMALENNH